MEGTETAAAVAEETVVAALATEATATETAAVETTVEKPWYEVESYDQIKAERDELAALRGEKDYISQSKQDYENRLSILKKVEEAPDPEILTLASFKKNGIDVETGTRIMGATPEQLKENPLQTLILEAAAKNPAKYKELGRSGTELAIREKYNLPEEGEYTPTALMRSDTIDAIQSLNKIKESVAETKDPYKFAAEQHELSNQQIAKRQESASTEAKAFASELKEVRYEDKESGITLKVSKEDIDSVLSQGGNYLGYLFDPTTKEGKIGIQNWVREQVLIQKFQNGEVLSEMRKTLSVEAKKEAVKEVHNGEPLKVDRNGTNPKVDKDNLTPVQRDLLSRGITPESLKGAV